MSSRVVDPWHLPGSAPAFFNATLRADPTQRKCETFQRPTISAVRRAGSRNDWLSNAGGIGNSAVWAIVCSHQIWGEPTLHGRRPSVAAPCFVTGIPVCPRRPMRPRAVSCDPRATAKARTRGLVSLSGASPEYDVKRTMPQSSSFLPMEYRYS